MIRTTPLFWSITALDALLFAVLLVMTLAQRSHGDGGREMAVFFFIVVPSVVLMAAAMLFHFSHSPIARGVALFVVAVPGLFFAWTQARDLYIHDRIAQDRSGAGYFGGGPMRAMGVAVVKHDVDTLKRIGPEVDVNAVGERGMTLLSLATQQDLDDLDVVRTLLALGAKADQAIDNAVRGKDVALLRLLLDAGADPNLRVDGGEPLVFHWLAVLTPEALVLLADRGLDLDSRSHDDPLAVVVTIHRRWDLLALLIERGADTDRPRPDGRTVAGELAAQIAETRSTERGIPPDLQRAQALVAARNKPF